MEFSKITFSYWTEKDFEDLNNAKTAKDMYVIASNIFSRMPRPIVQICGPIATGGLGDLDSNLHAFNEEIKKLQEKGLNVFDQMPFEMPMQELKKDLKPGGYAYSILDDFYLPIFKSGLIGTFYFMSNWQTSKGATWEHGLAKELGIEIKYLD
jgi:hypothetical protein